MEISGLLRRWSIFSPTNIWLNHTKSSLIFRGLEILFFVCNGKSMGTIFSNLAITCYLLPTLSNDRAYCHCHFCFIQRYLFTFFEWNYRLKIWFFFKNRLHDSYFFVNLLKSFGTGFLQRTRELFFVTSNTYK